MLHVRYISYMYFKRFISIILCIICNVGLLFSQGLNEIDLKLQFIKEFKKINPKIEYLSNIDTLSKFQSIYLSERQNLATTKCDLADSLSTPQKRMNILIGNKWKYCNEIYYRGEKEIWYKYHQEKWFVVYLISVLQESKMYRKIFLDERYEYYGLNFTFSEKGDIIFVMDFITK